MNIKFIFIYLYNKIIKYLPLYIQIQVQNFRILAFGFDQLSSIKSKEAILKDKPIPWFTYPAIEYLNQLDFSKKIIFEFGSGNSTIYWAHKFKQVYSIEGNKEWYNKLLEKIPENVTYNFFCGKDEYVNSILTYPKVFDVIVIDGKFRYECALNAINKLSNNGLIILDNSDWHEKTSKFLRECDLIQVDMSGFGPINNYTWTTSFFFRRNVQLTPAFDGQPVHCIGGLKHIEEINPF